jgi:hypothetical protein
MLDYIGWMKVSGGDKLRKQSEFDPAPHVNPYKLVLNLRDNIVHQTRMLASRMPYRRRNVDRYANKGCCENHIEQEHHKTQGDHFVSTSFLHTLRSRNGYVNGDNGRTQDG